MLEDRNSTPPDSVVAELQARYPGRNPVFAAISSLKDPDKMVRFIHEYAKHLLECNPNDEEITSNPLRAAINSINYATGYYSRETAQRWMSVTESGHPIFGTAHLHTLISSGNPLFEAEE